MQLGLDVNFGLEGLAPQDTLAAAKEIEIIFEGAKTTGELTGKDCKRIADLAKQITGLSYVIKTLDFDNAVSIFTASFNTGGSGQIVTNEHLAKKAIEETESEFKKDPKSFVTVQAGNYRYNPKTQRFEDVLGKGNAFFIFIGSRLIKHLTAAELTAFILHEIGHTWYQTRQYLMFIEQSVVLQDTLNHVLDKGKNEDIPIKDYILAHLDKTTQRELWNTINKNKAKPKDYLIASLLIAGKRLNTSGLGDYKKQRHEQAADYFAVSCGYGLHAYTGIDKMRALDPTMSVTRTNASLAVGLIGSFIFPTFAPVAGVMLAITTLASYLKETNGSYDRPYARVQKLFTGLRGNLKHLEGIPTEIIKSQLAQLDALEEKLGKHKDTMAICDVMNVFFLRDRWGRKNEEALEALLNNPLYISALRFRLQE